MTLERMDHSLERPEDVEQVPRRQGPGLDP